MASEESTEVNKELNRKTKNEPANIFETMFSMLDTITKKSKEENEVPEKSIESATKTSSLNLNELLNSKNLFSKVTNLNNNNLFKKSRLVLLPKILGKTNTIHSSILEDTNETGTDSISENVSSSNLNKHKRDFDAAPDKNSCEQKVNDSNDHESHRSNHVPNELKNLEERKLEKLTEDRLHTIRKSVKKEKSQSKPFFSKDDWEKAISSDLLNNAQNLEDIGRVCVADTSPLINTRRVELKVSMSSMEPDFQHELMDDMSLGDSSDSKAGENPMQLQDFISLIMDDHSSSDNEAPSTEAIKKRASTNKSTPSPHQMEYNQISLFGSTLSQPSTSDMKSKQESQSSHDCTMHSMEMKSASSVHSDVSEDSDVSRDTYLDDTNGEPFSKISNCVYSDISEEDTIDNTYSFLQGYSGEDEYKRKFIYLKEKDLTSIRPIDYKKHLMHSTVISKNKSKKIHQFDRNKIQHSRQKATEISRTDAEMKNRDQNFICAIEKLSTHRLLIDKKQRYITTYKDRALDHSTISAKDYQSNRGLALHESERSERQAKRLSSSQSRSAQKNRSLRSTKSTSSTSSRSSDKDSYRSVSKYKERSPVPGRRSKSIEKELDRATDIKKSSKCIKDSLSTSPRSVEIESEGRMRIQCKERSPQQTRRSYSLRTRFSEGKIVEQLVRKSPHPKSVLSNSVGFEERRFSNRSKDCYVALGSELLDNRVFQNHKAVEVKVVKHDEKLSITKQVVGVVSGNTDDLKDHDHHHPSSPTSELIVIDETDSDSNPSDRNAKNHDSMSEDVEPSSSVNEPQTGKKSNAADENNDSCLDVESASEETPVVEQNLITMPKDASEETPVVEQNLITMPKDASEETPVVEQNLITMPKDAAEEIVDDHHQAPHLTADKGANQDSDTDEEHYEINDSCHDVQVMSACLTPPQDADKESGSDDDHYESDDHYEVIDSCHDGELISEENSVEQTDDITKFEPEADTESDVDEDNYEVIDLCPIDDAQITDSAPEPDSDIEKVSGEVSNPDQSPHVSSLADKAAIPSFLKSPTSPDIYLDVDEIIDNDLDERKILEDNQISDATDFGIFVDNEHDHEQRPRGTASSPKSLAVQSEETSPIAYTLHSDFRLLKDVNKSSHIKTIIPVEISAAEQHAVQSSSVTAIFPNQNHLPSDTRLKDVNKSSHDEDSKTVMTAIAAVPTPVDTSSPIHSPLPLDSMNNEVNNKSVYVDTQFTAPNNLCLDPKTEVLSHFKVTDYRNVKIPNEEKECLQTLDLDFNNKQVNVDAATSVKTTLCVAEFSKETKVNAAELPLYPESDEESVLVIDEANAEVPDTTKDKSDSSENTQYNSSYAASFDTHSNIKKSVETPQDIKSLETLSCNNTKSTDDIETSSTNECIKNVDFSTNCFEDIKSECSNSDDKLSAEINKSLCPRKMRKPRCSLDVILRNIFSILSEQQDRDIQHSLTETISETQTSENRDKNNRINTNINCSASFYLGGNKPSKVCDISTDEKRVNVSNSVTENSGSVDNAAVTSTKEKRLLNNVKDCGTEKSGNVDEIDLDKIINDACGLVRSTSLTNDIQQSTSCDSDIDNHVDTNADAVTATYDIEQFIAESHRNVTVPKETQVQHVVGSSKVSCTSESVQTCDLEMAEGKANQTSDKDVLHKTAFAKTRYLTMKQIKLIQGGKSMDSDVFFGQYLLRTNKQLKNSSNLGKQENVIVSGCNMVDNHTTSESKSCSILQKVTSTGLETNSKSAAPSEKVANNQPTASTDSTVYSPTSLLQIFHIPTITSKPGTTNTSAFISEKKNYSVVGYATPMRNNLYSLETNPNACTQITPVTQSGKHTYSMLEDTSHVSNYPNPTLKNSHSKQATTSDGALPIHTSPGAALSIRNSQTANTVTCSPIIDPGSFVAGSPSSSPGSSGASVLPIVAAMSTIRSPGLHASMIKRSFASGDSTLQVINIPMAATKSLPIIVSPASGTTICSTDNTKERSSSFLSPMQRNNSVEDSLTSAAHSFQFQKVSDTVLNQKQPDEKKRARNKKVEKDSSNAGVFFAYPINYEKVKKCMNEPQEPKEKFAGRIVSMKSTSKPSSVFSQKTKNIASTHATKGQLGDFYGCFLVGKVNGAYICFKCKNKFSDKTYFRWHLWYHVHLHKEKCASCNSKDPLVPCATTDNILNTVTNLENEQIFFVMAKGDNQDLFESLCSDKDSHQVTAFSRLAMYKDNLASINTLNQVDTTSECVNMEMLESVTNEGDDDDDMGIKILNTFSLSKGEVNDESDTIGNEASLHIDKTNELSNNLFEEQNRSVTPPNNENLPGEFFKCSKCKFSSLFETSFEGHIFSVHASSHSFKCYYCDFETLGMAKFFQHYVEHVSSSQDQPVFSCAYERCRDKSNVLEHHLKHVTTHKLWKPICSHCNLICDSVIVLSNHYKKYLISLFACPYCDAKAVDKKTYLNHVSQDHNLKGRMVIIRKTLVCSAMDICQTNDQDENTTDAIIDTPKPTPALKTKPSSTSDACFSTFLCQKCSFISNDKKYFLYHKKLHNTSSAATDDFPFTCTCCPDTFAFLFHLKDHLKYHNEDVEVELFQCPIDDFMTNDVAAGMIHLSKVGHSDLELKKLQSYSHKSCIYNCTICGIKVKDKDIFQRHLFIHGKAGEKIAQQISSSDMEADTSIHPKKIKHSTSPETAKNSPSNLNTGASCSMLETSNQSTTVSIKTKLFQDKTVKPVNIIVSASPNLRLSTQVIDQKLKVLYTQKSGFFLCSVCHAMFRIKNQLSSHLVEHLNIPYQCSKCGEQCSTYDSAIFHVLIAHNMEQTNIMYSDHIIERINGLAEALKSSKVHSSSTAQEDFSKRINFLRQQKTFLNGHKTKSKIFTSVRVYSGENPTISDNEMTSSKNPDNNGHSISAAESEKLAFLQEEETSLALLSLMRQGFECNWCMLCNKSFSRCSIDFDDYKEHILTMHLKYKPFKCSQCAFTAYSQKSFAVHSRTRHSGLEIVVENNSIKEMVAAVKIRLNLNNEESIVQNTEDYFQNDSVSNKSTRSQTSTMYCCEICQMEIDCPFKLLRHKKFSHSTNKATTARKSTSCAESIRSVLRQTSDPRYNQCARKSTTRKSKKTNNSNPTLVASTEVVKSLKSPTWSAQKSTTPGVNNTCVTSVPHTTIKVEAPDPQPLPLEPTKPCVPEKPQFVCQQCDFVTEKRKRAMIYHFKKHGFKCFVECPHCKAKYTAMKLLLKHFELIHRGMEMIPKYLHIADYFLPIGAAEIAQIKANRRQASTTCAAATRDVKTLLPYTCVFCNLEEAKKEYMRYHIYTHLDYKPYNCNTCPMAFSNPFQQQKHIREDHTSCKAKSIYKKRIAFEVKVAEIVQDCQRTCQAGLAQKHWDLDEVQNNLLEEEDTSEHEKDDSDILEKLVKISNHGFFGTRKLEYPDYSEGEDELPDPPTELPDSNKRKSILHDQSPTKKMKLISSDKSNKKNLTESVSGCLPKELEKKGKKKSHKRPLESSEREPIQSKIPKYEGDPDSKVIICYYCEFMSESISAVISHTQQHIRRGSEVSLLWIDTITGGTYNSDGRIFSNGFDTDVIIQYPYLCGICNFRAIEVCDVLEHEKMVHLELHKSAVIDLKLYSSINKGSRERNVCYNTPVFRRKSQKKDKTIVTSAPKTTLAETETVSVCHEKSSGRIKFNCPECSHNYYQEYEYRCHLATHKVFTCLVADLSQNSQLKCGVCSYRAPNIRKFTRHMLGHNRLAVKFICGYCGYRADNTRSIKMHHHKRHEHQEFDITKFVDKAPLSRTLSLLVDLEPKVKLENFMEMTQDRFKFIVNQRNVHFEK